MAQTEEAGAPTDVEILRQQEEIHAEIAAESPIVAPLATLETLLKRETRPNVLRKIDELKSNYKGVYCIRGDGNCFFRSFLLGMFIRFVEDPTSTTQRLDVLIEFITKSKEYLIATGMPEFAIEDFWDEFKTQLSSIKSNELNLQTLLHVFNDPTVSDYLVMYARFLTSWYLQTNSEQYMPYIQDCATMQQFVRSEVEPMGKEADHIHCIALTRCLDIPIRIEYLDNSSGHISHVLFPEGSEPLLSLLYRPGHYDLLQEKR